MISVQLPREPASCAYPALLLALREGLLDGFHGGVNFCGGSEVNKGDEREPWGRFIAVISNRVSHVVLRARGYFDD